MLFFFSLNINYLYIANFSELYCLFLLFFYFFILKNGKIEYNKLLMLNKNLLKKKSNKLIFDINLHFLLSMYNSILDFLTYLFFYLTAYFPILFIFKWKTNYINKVNKKFRYNLRIDYIINKRKFTFKEKEINIKSQYIFKNLLSRWLINFWYMLTMYIIYFKIIFRLLFFFSYYFCSILLYILKLIFFFNILKFYFYDIYRYSIIYLHIYIYSLNIYKYVNKYWVILDYLKYEFVYLVYNVPYFFFFSSFISFINFLFIKIFAFYNRFRFDIKISNNIITFAYSEKFLLNFSLANNINIEKNSTFYIIYMCIKSFCYFIYLKILFLNRWNNKMILYKNFLLYLYKVNIYLDFIFHFFGFTFYFLLKITYNFLIIILNFIYFILKKFRVYWFLFFFFLIILFFFDFYVFLSMLNFIIIIFNPLKLLLQFIYYNLYYNEIWFWFYNFEYNISFYLIENQNIILIYKKFIISIEKILLNYLYYSWEEWEDLKLIFFNINKIHFRRFTDLIFYWYAKINFDIILFLKIILYYLFYYLYFYFYYSITPFIFLYSNTYYYFYYFWYIYIYILLLLKIIYYYFVKLCIYIFPYYFYPVLNNSIYNIIGIIYKYKYSMIRIFLGYINVFIYYLFIYLFNVINIFINFIYKYILLFIDVFLDIRIIYIISFYSHLFFSELIKNSINFYYENSLNFYFLFIHFNIVQECQSILDLTFDYFRISRLNIEKFNLILENNFYISKIRILGLKTVNPINQEIVDFYKPFIPLSIIRGDTLYFINVNFYLTFIKRIKTDIFSISLYILLDDVVPIIFRLLKYYFLIFYFIFYFIFRYIIINNNNYEYNLNYLWKYLRNNYKFEGNEIFFSKIKKQEKEVSKLTKTVNKKKYILNKNKKLIKDFIINKIFYLNNNLNKLLRNYSKIILGNNELEENNLNPNLFKKTNQDLHLKLRSTFLIRKQKYKNLFDKFLYSKQYENFVYILNNNYNNLLFFLQLSYNKNKYIYNYCNLQTNIFEEEYSYLKKNRIKGKFIYKIHSKITFHIISYFNFLEKLIFKYNGPDWLLNKNYATLFFNRNLGTEVILTPYVMAANEGFFWIIFIPFIIYNFLLYLSSNLYNILYIEEYFIYLYIYMFIENFDFLYNFYINLIHIYNYMDCDFNFYALSKQSEDADFMYIHSSKIHFYDYLNKYKNLFFIFNNYNNKIIIIYHPYLNIINKKLFIFYFLQYLVLIFLILNFLLSNFLLFTIKKTIFSNKKFSIIINFFIHYKFILNKKINIINFKQKLYKI